MRTKLIAAMALLSASCVDTHKKVEDIHLVELYSGGTIINVWEAKDVKRVNNSDGLSFTDIYCGCTINVSGTYIVTRLTDED